MHFSTNHQEPSLIVAMITNNDASFGSFLFYPFKRVLIGGGGKFAGGNNRKTLKTFSKSVIIYAFQHKPSRAIPDRGYDNKQ